MADKKNLPVPHHVAGDGKGKSVTHGNAKSGIKGKPAVKSVRRISPRSAKVKKA